MREHDFWSKCIACLFQAGTLLRWFTGQKEISESSCESLEYSMNYIQVLQHREMLQMVQGNEISNIKTKVLHVVPFGNSISRKSLKS